MSKEVLFKTVGKAVKEPRFRSSLLKDPKRALSGLSLTREEYSAITQLTNESFEFLGKNVDPKAFITSSIFGFVAEESQKTLSRYNLNDFSNLISG